VDISLSFLSLPNFPFPSQRARRGLEFGEKKANSQCKIPFGVRLILSYSEAKKYCTAII
jgi:hypothetical protein